MNTKQLDWLNIGLMLTALILAKRIPFELFLFSYATLSQKVCKLKSLVYLEFNPVFKNNQKLV